jgi:hypothetical protein
MIAEVNKWKNAASGMFYLLREGPALAGRCDLSLNRGVSSSNNKGYCKVADHVDGGGNGKNDDVDIEMVNALKHKDHFRTDSGMLSAGENLQQQQQLPSKRSRL